ncbi:Cupredoxin [Choiromyces venosus 120613-1]|uniref:Cupredoxin n=1 Tax=Choiromyces venosus 120613-1 TaxID=1336337 RepID=A0A3N4JRP1_9PEZI|nr:Cupredoxin [Choiromyces venosus 120613-1]
MSRSRLIENLSQQVYPNLQATNLQGYNAQVPGPLIRATTGRKFVVRSINHVTSPASIPLHGSPSRPVFDDVIEKNEYKDYVYPDEAARTLWYHDHPVHITAENVFSGQAGFYIIIDPAVEATLDLPQGNYDIPLLIQDKIYLASGQTLSPATEETNQLGYYGHVIHVNSVPWPFLNVKPRKHRFRLLDGSSSRSYKITIEQANGVKVPIVVVGTDSGFMEAPVTTDNMILAIAERYEVIVDFTAYAGQSLTMKNARSFSLNPEFEKTNLVMQFNVGTAVSSAAGNGPVPNSLVDLNFPTDTGIDKRFRFERRNGQWVVNGVGFADVNNRILAAPTQGSTEIWELQNFSGGWAHPIHVRLVGFKVLTRSGRVHCHNTIHEDQDMMAVFDVNNTKANPSQGDQFSNPLNPTFVAKPYSSTDPVQVQSLVLPYFANLNIYPSD